MTLRNVVPIKFRSLTVQILLSFILVVLLTAAAAWFPEIRLIRDQLDRQAWAQVEQGRRTTRALYRSWQSEVANSAMLVAQLPSLQALLEQGTSEDVAAYLSRFVTRLDVDTILVCDTTQEPVVLVPSMALPEPANLCELENPAGVHVVTSTSTPEAWLLATGTVGENGSSVADVIVGIALDDAFTAEMSTQTGFEHTLLVDGRPVATSLAGGVDRWRAAGSDEGDGDGVDRPRRSFSVDDEPYYATRLSLNGARVEDEVALGVSDLAETKRRVLGTVTLSIMLVAVLGSLAGVVLARRISTPLARLSEAAWSFSKGDLETPVRVETEVHETARVAEALEQARVDLRRTVSDLQQEKVWIEHLLEAVVEGIVTLDKYGNVTFFSKGAERITGWSEEDVLGRSCDEVFRPTDTSAPFSALVPPPDGRRKIAVTFPEARQATLSVTRAELVPPEAGEAHLALVFRDVTEEEAIQRLLGHFLANVTHEFRTPLSALEAAIELLLDQADDLEPDELERLLVSLHLGILGLQRLVDNLLESASIEVGRFHVTPHPVDLGKIVADAVRTMRPLLDKYDQRLTVDLPEPGPVVQADRQRIVQVLVNLLSNASKYGPEDADVVVGATVEGAWVRVTVADRGPGIDADHRDDLFRRFVYHGADDETAAYGVGLGLWIVKAIVEAHGGDVGVEDRSGGGSIFWFTLPVAEDV